MEAIKEYYRIAAISPQRARRPTETKGGGNQSYTLGGAKIHIVGVHKLGSGTITVPRGCPPKTGAADKKGGGAVLAFTT